MKIIKTEIIYPEYDKDKVLLPTKLVEAIKADEVVILPTETVYGLAANALSENAVNKIFTAKGRPKDNPLIVHISDFEMWEELVLEIPDNAKKLATTFWPGPLTIILPKSDKVTLAVSGGLDTVAVRMPKHPVALAVIKESALPLAAPSANLSGKPSPTTLLHCTEDMMGRVPYIVEGGDCAFGVESTVLDMSSDIPIILRPGAVTKLEIEECIGQVLLDENIFKEVDDDEAVKSPGMKYTHYAPRAPVYMVKGGIDAFAEYVNNEAKQNEGVYALIFSGEEKYINCPYATYGNCESSIEQAQRLFSALRTLDNEKVKTIYARAPIEDGVGLAVYNRLIRASGFNIVDLRCV